MAWGYGQPAPKPAKGEDRIARRRAREAEATRFRAAVWTRAGGQCEWCGRAVIRTLDVLRADAGHVAHDRGRNCAPEDRYRPEAAQLLCRACHLGGDHGMRF